MTRRPRCPGCNGTWEPIHQTADLTARPLSHRIKHRDGCPVLAQRRAQTQGAPVTTEHASSSRQPLRVYAHEGPMPLEELRAEVRRRRGFGLSVPQHWLTFLEAADAASTARPLTCGDAKCSHAGCTPEGAA